MQVCERVCTPIPSTNHQPDISNLTNVEICELEKMRGFVCGAERPFWEVETFRQSVIGMETNVSVILLNLFPVI